MVFFQPSPTLSARVRRHLFNLLAVLLTLEVCCRLFVPEQFEMVVRDPQAGRSLVKNLDRNLFCQESGRLVRVRTNSFGFRGPEPRQPTGDGVRRVVVLGDSFISALQVEFEETLCFQLERALNESASPERWEVLNFGVTGSGTGDQHVRYLGTLRDLEPDLVVVGFGMGTDPVDNNPHLSNSPLAHYDFDDAGELVLAPDSAMNAEAANFLNSHCHLYLWQKSVSNRWIKGVRNQAGWFDKRDRIYLDPAPDEIEYCWRLTDAILKRFHEDVVADGAEFLLVTIPSSREIYRDLFDELEAVGRQAGVTAEFRQDLPLERVTAICRRHGIPLLELEEPFRSMAPARDSRIEEQRLFYNGHGHLNVKGNRVAAELIAARLLRGKTSPGARPQVAEEPSGTQLR
jgi:hypothetical protein